MKKSELLNLLDQMDKQEPSPANPHERVLLIDGLNLFFRNFAMMNFVNEQGVHIGGLGGFIRSLNSLINQVHPTSVYVVFDGIGSSTNRKNMLPEYKSGRNLVRITNWDVFENLEEEHDAKVDQIVRLIHYLKCLPVKTLSLSKVEADDVIAYLSDILPSKHNSQVFIVFNDKDIFVFQGLLNVFNTWHQTEKIGEDRHRRFRCHGSNQLTFIKAGCDRINVDKNRFVAKVDDHIKNWFDGKRWQQHTTALRQVQCFEGRPNSRSRKRKYNTVAAANITCESSLRFIYLI